MAKRVWRFQEAKNAFSAIVNEALREGPQIITRHGKKTAVVLSYDDYEKTVAPQKSLLELFRNSPLVGVELDLERGRGEIRDVDL